MIKSMMCTAVLLWYTVTIVAAYGQEFKVGWARVQRKPRLAVFFVAMFREFWERAPPPTPPPVRHANATHRPSRRNGPPVPRDGPPAALWQEGYAGLCALPHGQFLRLVWPLPLGSVRVRGRREFATSRRAVHLPCQPPELSGFLFDLYVPEQSACCCDRQVVNEGAAHGSLSPSDLGIASPCRLRRVATSHRPSHRD